MRTGTSPIVTSAVSSLTFSPPMRAPPPLIRRRASPFEVASPSATSASTIPIDPPGTAKVGRSPPAAPSSNVRRAVSAAVENLPEYQRQMINMFHVEMLSYEEIAEQMNLPIGTVKSRLNRARLGLRHQLEGDRELFGTDSYAYSA